MDKFGEPCVTAVQMLQKLLFGTQCQIILCFLGSLCENHFLQIYSNDKRSRSVALSEEIDSENKS